MSAVEIDLTELGDTVDRELTLDQGRMFAQSGVVTAVPSAYQPGWWTIGPASRVGAARIGDVVVRIRPKVPIARLLFLLGYSVHGAAWQASSVSLDESDDLVPAVAEALRRQVAHAIGQGLLPGYVQVEESSLVLRGRLLESAQLTRHHGLPLPLEIRHDEFTVDIPENQILRTACERMLHVPRVPAPTQARLRRLLREFGDVTTLHPAHEIPAWQPTRLNVRYQAALRLAELVLKAMSVEHSAGTIAVNGFLLAMPQLFEDFVTVAIREALEGAYGGKVIGQSRDYHLDEDDRVSLRPDIIWHLGGQAVAVADAKYKAEKPAGYPNADLYQILAYCTVLGLKVGHLIYAKGNEDPVRHVVRSAGTEVICHALDLSQPPDMLLAEARTLARHIHDKSRRPSQTRHQACD